MGSQGTRWLNLVLVVFLLWGPEEGLSMEYGEACDSDGDCKSIDFRDPLLCNIPEEPTTSQPLDDDPDISSEDINSPLQRQSFGEAFDTEIFNAGVCSCLESMYRHKELNRCVSPSSGPCDLRSDNGDPIRTCTKFAQCFPFSNGTGSCRCDSDAKEVHAQECKLTHGSNRCDVPSDCDIYSHLTCNNGTCVCEFGDSQKWSEVHGKCVSAAGESCTPRPPIPDQLCVPNAFCNTNQICECNSTAGFVPTPEKDCKLDYNGTCTGDDDCFPTFTCSADSRCQCPGDQIFFESTKLCHLPAASACNSSLDTCTLHSTCLNDTNTCTCDDGYEAHPEDGSCNALHGASCSDEVPCHPDKFLNDCPASDGSGHCDCRENYNYNEERQRCVGNLEESCSVDEDCINDTGCSSGVCACGENHIPGRDKQTCYSGYGNSCDQVGCHPDFNIKCDQRDSGDRICICEHPEDQVYSESRSDCVALAGKSCNEAGEKNTHCVDNAQCTAQDGQTLCLCLNGYGANSTGHCQQGGGASALMPVGKTYLYIILITVFSLKLVI